LWVLWAREIATAMIFAEQDVIQTFNRRTLTKLNIGKEFTATATKKIIVSPT
jgi:hypothetical protein